MSRRSDEERSLGPSASEGLFDSLPIRLHASDEIVASRIPSVGPHHTPRALTAAQREVFRQTAARSRLAKTRAMNGNGPEPLHDVNKPLLRPLALMPQLADTKLRALSLFSGGGGLDIGFAQAGYQHAASYEILSDAAATLVKARPDWEVHGGSDGDVTKVDWRRWRDRADIVHGGPPCQPFSNAGRQKGHEDSRDMWPSMIECIKAVRPLAFIAENVPALGSAKFSEYVRTQIIEPLSPKYKIRMLTMRAQDFGVPQSRRRVIFVGFARAQDDRNFVPPAPTHVWGDAALDSDPGLQRCMGVREALGLPDIGFDALSPTIRSSLTGPRHTTSILNSVAAARTFAKLEVWPNGVALTRERARAFVADNGHFRLAVPDVAVLQGFPDDWPLVGATYMQLGQIGNAVPPPLAYAVASSVAEALA